MFLDEKLLEIARTKHQTKEEMLTTIRKMLLICWDDFKTKTKLCKSDVEIESQIIRINNTWNNVRDTLEKENINFILPDGFKEFLNELLKRDNS